MIVEGGGFASSSMPTPKGEEGKFYVWSPEEIVAALGLRTRPGSVKPMT